MQNEAPILHKKLLEKFKNTDNWMTEWWINKAYLGYRNPVIVHSSPGTIGPQMNFREPYSFITNAARIVIAISEYDKLVKSGKIKQEFVRNEPLDMQPYGMFLGSHRQPAPICDKLLHNNDAKHIIIICNNNFYKLNIIDESGIMPENSLKASLKDIIDRSQIEGDPVGILTGNHRDVWAEDYNILISLGNNKNNIKDIETSLFALCLDKNMPQEAFNCKNVSSVRAVQCLTGYSTDVNAANRWHDKTVQYIISEDGCVGMLYEHSPCEGGPIAILQDYVLKYLARRENAARKELDKSFPRATLLKFELNERIRESISQASCAVNELSEDTDMVCFKFKDFGFEMIKSLKLSPDSFIQMAMNTAFYKVQGKPPAHYETASLRRFHNARTECIRSTSTDSVYFAKLLISNDSTQAKKQAMLKAIDTHKKIVSEAVIGQGVDRHLFGLKMIALEEGIQLPEFYKDAGYTRSTHFTLTSSQVAYKTESFMCYGPVAPDGYGCCYNPRLQDIFFACSSFNSCPTTNTEDFANALQETLREMLELAKS
ncbi:carnitine O-acetyltransferase-like isoform X2 [Prorops nasuta]